MRVVASVVAATIARSLSNGRGGQLLLETSRPT